MDGIMPIQQHSDFTECKHSATEQNNINLRQYVCIHIQTLSAGHMQFQQRHIAVPSIQFGWLPGFSFTFGTCT